MRSITLKGAACAAALLLAGAAHLPGSVARAAEEMIKVYSKAGKFTDVDESLRDAIIKRGFVIDYVGELNKMLTRTAADTGTVTSGGKSSPFKNAHFLQFCPSKLTHEAVNTNPVGIANCPIAIFIYELEHEPGKVHVGYRTPVSVASKKSTEVNNRLKAVLADIAKEATK